MQMTEAEAYGEGKMKNLPGGFEIVMVDGEKMMRRVFPCPDCGHSAHMGRACEFKYENGQCYCDPSDMHEFNWIREVDMS